jgi:hypothetical protein
MRRYVVQWIENGRQEQRGFAFEDGALTRFLGMTMQARSGRAVTGITLRFLGADGEEAPPGEPNDLVWIANAPAPLTDPEPTASACATSNIDAPG